MNEEAMNYEAPKPNPTGSSNENETICRIVENFPVFGLTSVLYGVFFCFCLYRNMYSYTSLLLCIATIGYFLFCFSKLKIASFKMRKFYIACICLLGLSNMLTASYVLIFLNYIGILLLLFCFLIQHFYDTKKWDFSKYTSALIQTMFCSIGRLNYPFKSFSVFYKKNQKLKNSKALYVVIGLLISVPLLLVVGSLLLSADVVFRNLADNAFSELFKDFDFGTLIGIAITTLIGLTFSYGILIELCGKHIKPEVKEKKTMEPIIAITFTSVLTIVYLLFSVIQIVYLFIGNMRLPDNYTYAQYAREGFFQLLFVCIINLILVLFCMSHYRDNKILKGILTVLCGCTYIMIASSTMRMLMYIGTYHLTFLRVFVLLALLVLFLCLTGVVITIYKPGFPLFTYMLVVVSVCYISFSLSRPDTYIATYNIRAEASDMYYYYELSPDAAPILANAGLLRKEKNDNNPSYAGENYMKNNYIHRCRDGYDNLNFRRFNLSVYQAGKSILAKQQIN
ncbi:MAG: DUF4173 domain-containing protein [Lachnospiraceae bacterium]|nr:DUF4173 domain-containing protein [Lachnospiraceae bacterium]